MHVAKKSKKRTNKQMVEIRNEMKRTGQSFDEVARGLAVVPMRHRRQYEREAREREVNESGAIDLSAALGILGAMMAKRPRVTPLPSTDRTDAITSTDGEIP